MNGLRLNLSDITKSYDRRNVLKGCSYGFEQGKLHAVIGPNGSGKSTLLRLCCLIEDPDSGEIQFSDNEGSLDLQSPGLRRRISLVFSKGGLFNTTVFQNASYGLKIRGVSLLKRRSRVKGILNRVGLWEKRHQNAITLSAGEGQRLALARVLVTDPEIIMLDEPTVSLDPVNTGIIENLISGLMKDGNRTIIMATHNMFQAQRLSDRVIFMHDGSLYDEGDTKEFFENPGHEIAGQFISGKLIY